MGMVKFGIPSGEIRTLPLLREVSLNEKISLTSRCSPVIGLVTLTFKMTCVDSSSVNSETTVIAIDIGGVGGEASVAHALSKLNHSLWQSTYLVMRPTVKAITPKGAATADVAAMALLRWYAFLSAAKIAIKGFSSRTWRGAGAFSSFASPMFSLISRKGLGICPGKTGDKEMANPGFRNKDL